MFADTDPVQYGTLLWQGGLAVLAIVLSVAALFKTMGSSYGEIISALQRQNIFQQGKIDSLEVKLAAKEEKLDRLIEDHKACNVRLTSLEEQMKKLLFPKQILEG